MNLIKAGGDDLVWLVVGIFWVIAQITGGAAKKAGRKKALPADSGENPESAETPLPDWLKQLNETLSENAQPDSGEIPLFPEPVPELETLPDPTLTAPVFVRVAEPPPVPKPVLEPVAEIDIRPTMKAFRAAAVAMKQPSMNLRIQGLERSARTTPSSATPIQPGDRNSLRRAMLSHILFSPPKALEK